MIICQPRTAACTHRRRRLVTEGPTYEIWQCIRCDQRKVIGRAQLSLFSLGEAQLGALEEELPIPS